MDPTMDPTIRADNSAGNQALQASARKLKANQILGHDHTDPVKVMPNQVQMIARCDDHGRRYMVLENLPLDQNYVASRINSGAEFAIGGTPSFISKAFPKEFAGRLGQDVRNQYTQQSLWHVVVLPDSNISNAPRFNFDRESLFTRDLPVATALRPTQQDPLTVQPAIFPQESHQTNELAISSQQNPYISQQPMTTQHNSVGGHGQGASSVAPSQRSHFTTPMPDTFSSGGRSTMSFPQEHFYTQTPQQGNFQGFPARDGSSQGNYHGQGNNMMFNQSSGPPMGSLPQVHRPIFDKQGYIIGEEGDMNALNMYDGNMYGSSMYGGHMYGSNLYSSNMYGNNMVDAALPMSFQGPQQPFNPAQQAQNGETTNPQVAAAAQPFWSFVENRMDQDNNYHDQRGQDEGELEENTQSQVSQNERDQDEGIALGYTSSNNAINFCNQLAAPNQLEHLLLPQKLLMASYEEPHRFADNTGTNLCDYCGRDGHEADVCLKWDPDHFDKPVCTACNNDQHSLDECPKFRAMAMPERVTLLLGKGALRPGVRSEYHAWTRYARHGNHNGKDGAGLPLARLVLQTLSRSKDIGTMIQNVWKVWDYGRGYVPDLFLQAGKHATGLGAKSLAESDESFKGGQHNLDQRMPVQPSISRVPPNQGWRQPPQKPGPQVRNYVEEDGDETEL